MDEGPEVFESGIGVVFAILIVLVAGFLSILPLLLG